jgi:hypothetical protein
MGADQFDATICQAFSQRVAVGGTIVDQAIRNLEPIRKPLQFVA